MAIEDGLGYSGKMNDLRAIWEKGWKPMPNKPHHVLAAVGDELMEKRCGMTKPICLFYALGKSETELLASDEYDSEGNGWFLTDDPLMWERYIITDEAEATAKKLNLKVYIVEIEKDGDAHRIRIEEQ
ncbi:hypothetical protein FACS1894163_09220 [Spirochaetia bacterium]|nr:hypothetical protein FACS1894163_09220 [Spirochaetia bacterium]